MTLTQDMQLDIFPTESFPLTGAQSVILALFRQRGSFTDSELNDHYSLNWEFQGWPQMRYDTPRRRRSDLTNLGLIVADEGEKRRNRFNGLEQVWKVSHV